MATNLFQRRRAAMSLSRRRAAAIVPAPQSRSESRSVGNDETTLSAKTKARAPSSAHPMCALLGSFHRQIMRWATRMTAKCNGDSRAAVSRTSYRIYGIL